MSDQKKPKVLFTSHTANFQKFNRPFMRWFREQNWEVHYASAGEEDILDCDEEFKVPFERSPLKLNNLKAYRQLKKIIDENNYDIIHTHTPVGSVVTRLAARHARRRGTRVIYTAHGFHFFKGAPLLNWLIYYPVEKMMAHYTNTLITVNREDFQIAKERFATEVRHVRGVGIDPKKFNFEFTDKNKSILRKSLGLNDSDFIMIYVAELSARKNQLWLVEAMSEFLKSHPHAHIVLPGTDSLNGRVHTSIARHKLTNQIHLLGYRNDIPELLRSSDLSLSTSKQEGLPVNIMEAMYVGLPIVATNCRGNADLIRNNERHQLIEMNDARAFSEAVQKYYSNHQTAKKAKRVKDEVIDQYMIDPVLNDMRAIYGI